MIIIIIIIIVTLQHTMTKEIIRGVKHKQNYC